VDFSKAINSKKKNYFDLFKCDFVIYRKTQNGIAKRKIANRVQWGRNLRTEPFIQCFFSNLRVKSPNAKKRSR